MFTISPIVQRRELFERLLTLKKLYAMRGKRDKVLLHEGLTLPVYNVEGAQRFLDMRFHQVIKADSEFQGHGHIYG